MKGLIYCVLWADLTIIATLAITETIKIGWSLIPTATVLICIHHFMFSLAIANSVSHVKS